MPCDKIKLFKHNSDAKDLCIKIYHIQHHVQAGEYRGFFMSVLLYRWGIWRWRYLEVDEHNDGGDGFAGDLKVPPEERERGGHHIACNEHYLHPLELVPLYHLLLFLLFTKFCRLYLRIVKHWQSAYFRNTCKFIHIFNHFISSTTKSYNKIFLRYLLRGINLWNMKYI